MPDNSRVELEKTHFVQWECSKRCLYRLDTFHWKITPFSRLKSREKISNSGGLFLKTGLTKKQKVTEVIYNAKDHTAEIYTHDAKLKKRLRAFAEEYPELCRQTDDDEQGGLTFEIEKGRFSFRLTAPYSEERRQTASEWAKKNGIAAL